MKIIGIAGTNGSGKDTLGEILANDFGWYFVSVTDILRAEVKKRGLPPERKHTSQVSAEWRRESGLGVLIDKAVEIFEAFSEQYNGLVIASLRNPGEADEVHKLGGQVVWVDAGPKIRYARVESRARGPEDHKSYEQFLQEEQDEMHNHTADDTGLNMAAVKAKADILITNDGDSLETFKASIASKLAL